MKLYIVVMLVMMALLAMAGNEKDKKQPGKEKSFVELKACNLKAAKGCKFFFLFLESKNHKILKGDKLSKAFDKPSGYDEKHYFLHYPKDITQMDSNQLLQAIVDKYLLQLLCQGDICIVTMLVEGVRNGQRIFYSQEVHLQVDDIKARSGLLPMALLQEDAHLYLGPYPLNPPLKATIAEPTVPVKKATSSKPKKPNEEQKKSTAMVKEEPTTAIQNFYNYHDSVILQPGSHMNVYMFEQTGDMFMEMMHEQERNVPIVQDNHEYDDELNDDPDEEHVKIEQGAAGQRDANNQANHNLGEEGRAAFARLRDMIRQAKIRQASAGTEATTSSAASTATPSSAASTATPSSAASTATSSSASSTATSSSAATTSASHLHQSGT